MSRIYKVAPYSGNLRAEDARAVADALAAGALALLPTETVYGVGVSIAAYSAAAMRGEMSSAADSSEGGLASIGWSSATSYEAPGDETGYGRIFTLKRRERSQTVPWLVAGPSALDEFGVDVPSEIRLLTERFWPGALTVVVPAAPCVPWFMRAADGTVALRSSASPVIAGLESILGSPLAVTSANTHGAPAPADFRDVETRVLDGVDVAVDAGATVCRDASTIVAVRDGEIRILREGALSAADIRSALA